MLTAIFSLPVRVYIEDTDAHGIVYHANHLRYMERARTEWLRSLGYNRADIEAMGMMLVVKKAEIDYCAPARLDDSLVSIVQSFTLQHASVTLNQAIYLLQHAEKKHISDHKFIKLCAAKVQIAFVDSVRFRPRPFAHIRNHLQKKYPMC